MITTKTFGVLFLLETTKAQSYPYLMKRQKKHKQLMDV